MPVGAIIGAVGAVGSALIGGGAAKSAAKTQADAANRAADMQWKQYEQTRTDLAPWRDAGAKTLSELTTRLPELTSAPDAANFRTDPGYQFRFDEGRRAIDSSAASKGMLLSGGTLKDLTRYGQGVADQQYSDWWNRERNVQDSTYSKLSDLTRMGQNSAALTGSLGAQAATNAGNAVMSGANASAAGQVGSANAINQGIGNLVSLAQTPGLFGGGSSTYARLTPSAQSTINSNPGIF